MDVQNLIICTAKRIDTISAKFNWGGVQLLKEVENRLIWAELGASLFEIAQSLFALEWTLILGAMALNKNKSDERTDKILIMSGSLMSDMRIKERGKNGWKTHKNARFVHILIKIHARQPPLVCVV